jgi:hypothetical protein
MGPTLLLADVMSRAGGVATAGHATWDGQRWGTLGSGVSFGNVEAVTLFNGQPVLGGSFLRDGLGVPKFHGIARWDGSAWQEMGQGFVHGAPRSGLVMDLRVWNGELVASGFDLRAVPFGTTVGVWKWNGTQWQTPGPTGRLVLPHRGPRGRALRRGLWACPLRRRDQRVGRRRGQSQSRLSRPRHGHVR